MLLDSNLNIDSTSINKASYSYVTETMKIEFTNGQVYEYENVGIDEFDGFAKADSQGKYFIENIKNKYSHQKLLNS